MDHDKLLAQFDELVGDGIVLHSQPHLTRIDDKGMTFELVVTDLLVAKSHAEKRLHLPSHAQPDHLPERPACFGPGSDIAFADPRLVFCIVRGTHYLAFNLFAVFRPQLLLLTIDSYRRQQHPLEEQDIAAAIELLQHLKAAGQDYYAFFNCGFAAGASRAHKHMQVVPRQTFFFPDQPDSDAKVPYKYFLHRFDGKDEYEPSKLLALYVKLLGKAKRLLGLSEDAQETLHNVLLTLDWLLVIPRQPVPGLEVSIPNSAGMMGSVWLPTKDKIEAWKRLGPSSILRQVGIAADDLIISE